MAAGTTLNAKNLEKLGAARLAGLMMEISAGDADAKRKLRLALAAAKSPRAAAAGISKRIAAIAKATSPLSGKVRERIEKDIETQRRSIMELVAPEDPGEAFELMWRFVDMESAVVERAGYNDFALAQTFRQGIDDLRALAPHSGQDPLALADTMFERLRDVWDDWRPRRHRQITGLAPALGEDGLARLKELLEELQRERAEEWAASEGDDPYSSQHGASEWREQDGAREALRVVADERGDPEGFAAQFDPWERREAPNAVEIARRFADAGRPDDALRFLDEADTKTARGEEDYFDRRNRKEWEDARIAVLDAAGRKEEAQALRRAVFDERLSAEHLRAYLAALPEFEDIEAEDEAMAQIARHPSFDDALAFLLDWPARDRAARLLTERGGEIRGANADLLDEAADALSAEFPLAASLALRGLVRRFADRIWKAGNRKRAEKRLAECVRLAPAIDDFDGHETHEEFAEIMRREFGLGAD